VLPPLLPVAFALLFVVVSGLVGRGSALPFLFTDGARHNPVHVKVPLRRIRCPPLQLASLWVLLHGHNAAGVGRRR